MPLDISLVLIGEKLRKRMAAGTIIMVEKKTISVSRWVEYPLGASAFSMHSIENHNFPNWLTVFDADNDSEKKAGIDML